MKHSAADWSARAHEALKAHFGYSAFRAGQADIIHSLLSGRDTLAVMPTGGGKSLCYQIPALLHDGVALVVSPLIALMKDQVDALRRARIPATEINSSLHFQELQQRMTNAKFGAYKLLYVAPERLESPQFLEQLRELNISFLAVDEAHCISEWGHDFRPAYRNIPEALTSLPRVPIIALTATATPEVRDDIVHTLGMNDFATFVKGFDRPNLHYATELCENKISRVHELVSATPTGSVIVYAGSRRKVEETARSLQHLGHAAGAYHAGLPDAQRQDTQDRFLSGDLRVLAATSAFGMGVDKPDVRRVIHTEITLTLEAYYQEAGRGGRDGKDSVCTALYHPRDRELQEFFLRSIYPEHDEIRMVYSFLYDTAGVAAGEKAMAPVYVDEVSVGNRLRLSASVVNGVLNLLERSQLLRRGPRNAQARLHLVADPERIREYFRNTTPERRVVLEMLLRGVGPEALRSSVFLDLQALSRKHDVPYDQCIEALRAFEFARILRFEPASGSGGIVLPEPRAMADRVPYDKESLEHRRRRAIEKLDDVVHYMETTECKRNVLLRYFNDEVHDTCGRCSSCLETTPGSQQSTAEQEEISLLVLQTIVELDERFGRTTVAAVLAGQDSSTIQRFALQRSAFFGKLRQYAVSTIIDSIDQLVASRLLATTGGERPTVRLTKKGREKLGDTLPERLTVQAPQQDSSERTQTNELITQLQRVRTELASRYNVSARTILSDEQLQALASNRPSSVQECTLIRGVGRVFVERYAREFLAVIHDYSIHLREADSESNLSEEHALVARLVRDGLSITDIAKHRSSPVGSVAGAVQEILAAGISLPHQNLISDSTLNSVRNELHRNPRAFLKELRAALGADISPAELRIAAAFVRFYQKKSLRY